MIDVELPLPPSTNRLHGVAKRGHHYRTAEYRLWRQDAGWALKLAYAQAIAGRYELTITLPSRCRIDPDNTIKAVSDLLVNHGLIPDDRATYCARIHVSASEHVANGRCRVIVTSCAAKEDT